MQNDSQVAAASVPATVTRAQTDDTISAMLFNSASLIPPTLYPIAIGFDPSPIIATSTTAVTIASPQIVYTQDDIEQAEADESIASSVAEKVRTNNTTITSAITSIIRLLY